MTPRGLRALIGSSVLALAAGCGDDLPGEDRQGGEDGVGVECRHLYNHTVV
jgi:hypothetical protein